MTASSDTSSRRSTRERRWLTGGKAPDHLDKGWYVEATLLTNVSNDMTVAQEEIFGPVIALIPYEDEEDAIRIANDSRFGLSGSVFTGDPFAGSKSPAVSAPARSRVNTMSADFNSSFGGYKESGDRPGAWPVRDRRIPADKTISIDPSEEVPEEVVRSVQATPAHV